MAAIDKTYIKSYKQYKEIADWCKAQGTVTDSFGNTITPYNYIPHIWKYPNDDYLSPGIDKGEYTEEYINEWLNNIKKDNEKYKTEEYWKKCLELYENYSEKYPTLDKWSEYVDTWAEIPLWNTDHVFDIYLIKNCPIQFIQDRLKEQYGGGWSKEAFTSHSNSYEAIKNGTSIYDTYKRNGLKNPHFNIQHTGANYRLKDDNIHWLIDVHVNDEFWMYDEVADYWFSDEECYMTKSNSWTSSNWKYYGNMSKHRIKRLLNKWNLPKGAVVNFVGEYNRYVVKTFKVIIK